MQTSRGLVAIAVSVACSPGFALSAEPGVNPKIQEIETVE